MGNQPDQLIGTSAGKAEVLKRDRLDYLEAAKYARKAQAAADPTRLTLMRLLRDAGETCVGDLCLLIEGEQSTISRHLRILAEAELISRRWFNRTRICALTKDGEQMLAAVLGDEDSEGEKAKS